MEILKEMPPRNPINGTFELTVRCNLKCKMCLFRHDDSENAEIMAKEKTAKEWIDMARQVAEAGTVDLLITGGEPMLRPDFCEIYEGIYKMGFIITLYTNATLITPKIMEIFRKYPPHKIGITIYGASDETYYSVCGNKSIFNNIVNGINMLSTLPSIIEFRTTIIKENYDDFPKIEKFVRETFGESTPVTHTRIVTKSVRGGCCDVESCRLSVNDNIKLCVGRKIKKIENIVGKEEFDINNINFYINNNLIKAKEEKNRVTLFGCDAGMSSYTISWDGKLLSCQMMGNFYTNPFENGFMEAWEDYPYEVRLPKLNKKCFSCKNIHLCSSCYATRYAETEDLGGCSEYLCSDVEQFLKLI